MIYVLVATGIVTLALIANWGLSVVGDYPVASSRLRGEAAGIGVFITFFLGITVLMAEVGR